MKEKIIDKMEEFVHRTQMPPFSAKRFENELDLSFIVPYLMFQMICLRELKLLSR